MLQKWKRICDIFLVPPCIAILGMDMFSLGGKIEEKEFFLASGTVLTRDGLYTWQTFGM